MSNDDGHRFAQLEVPGATVALSPVVGAAGRRRKTQRCGEGFGGAERYSDVEGARHVSRCSVVSNHCYCHSPPGAIDPPCSPDIVVVALAVKSTVEVAITIPSALATDTAHAYVPPATLIVEMPNVSVAADDESGATPSVTACAKIGRTPPPVGLPIPHTADTAVRQSNVVADSA